MSGALPNLAGKTVLVTGAAGFVGFHLAQALLTAGASVHGVDNCNAYYDPALKEARLAQLVPYPGFAFTRMDLTDHEGLADLFARVRPEIVVHLAAQAGVRHSLSHPRSYISANVDGFLGILEAARAHPVAHLLYASSSSVYGAEAAVPFREDDSAATPVSLYAATKRANELMAQTYAHLFRIPCSGLRFFTVYGPWGRPDMAYFSFTKAILEGRPIDLFNEGRMERDFTDVGDVTAAILRLIGQPPEQAAERLREALPGSAPHLIYNVGNHTPVQLSEFVAAIEAATGRTAQTRLLPMQPGDVPRTCADVTRLATVAGFSPATPIREGIARFVDWYRGYFG